MTLSVTFDQGPDGAFELPVAGPAPENTNAVVLRRWLYGHPETTKRAYSRDARQFLEFVGGIPLAEVNLDHAIEFLERPENRSLKPTSIARTIGTLRSLFAFACLNGFVPVNVLAGLKRPKVRDDLAERILSVDEVHRLLRVYTTDDESEIAGMYPGVDEAMEFVARSHAAGQDTPHIVEQLTQQGFHAFTYPVSKDQPLLVCEYRPQDRAPDPWYRIRNGLILRVLYVTGMRVAELVGLRWRDLQPTSDTGQVAVFGKGGKTRAIVLPTEVYHELVNFRAGAGSDAPAFPSRKGDGPVGRHQVWRIVSRAGELAELPRPIGPHFLRHSHISHALDAGCPAHNVRETVGHASLITTSRYAHARPGSSSALFLSLNDSSATTPDQAR